MTPIEETILVAARRIKPRGGLISFQQLYAALPQARTTVKRALISLERQSIIAFHRHNHFAAMSKAEKQAAIKQGENVYFAFSVREQNPMATKRSIKKRNRTIIKARKAVIVAPNPRYTITATGSDGRETDLAVLSAPNKAEALKRAKLLYGKAGYKKIKITLSDKADYIGRGGMIKVHRPRRVQRRKHNPNATFAQMLRGDAGYAAKRFAESVMDYARANYPTTEDKMRLVDAGLDAGASPMVIKRLLGKKLGAKTAARLVNARVQQRTRRNPARATAATRKTKALYEKFSGKKARKATTLSAPNGTPASVAKLGRLRKIKLTDGRAWNFVGNAAPYLAADSKGKLHVVGGKYRANPSGQTCGKVDLIEYETTKPHLGHKTPTIYFHQLGEETGQKPTMKIDTEGLIKFSGGAYRIEADGIHN